MKVLKMLCAISTLSMLHGCVPQGDYDKLQSENELLKAQVEEYQYGAERLIAEIERAYVEKEYGEARNKISALSEKHPQSAKNEEFKELLAVIDTEEKEAKERRAAEEKEQERLANLNSTGIWVVSYNVNDFGETTKEGYISNKGLIQGTFSNIATKDSILNARLLISSESDISIMLYEYASNTAVKAYSSSAYTVSVQDKDGERLELTANSLSDRLTFSMPTSQRVHQALMKGGQILFRIVESDTSATQQSFNSTHYSFIIQNSDGYDNAFRTLSET